MMMIFGFGATVGVNIRGDPLFPEHYIDFDAFTWFMFLGAVALCCVIPFGILHSRKTTIWSGVLYLFVVIGVISLNGNIVGMTFEHTNYVMGNDKRVC